MVALVTVRASGPSAVLIGLVSVCRRGVVVRPKTRVARPEADLRAPLPLAPLFSSGHASAITAARSEHRVERSGTRLSTPQDYRICPATARLFSVEPQATATWWSRSFTIEVLEHREPRGSTVGREERTRRCTESDFDLEGSILYKDLLLV